MMLPLDFEGRREPRGPRGRIRKAVGAENTFFSDLTEFDAMAAVLQPLNDKVWCDTVKRRAREVGQSRSR